MDEEDRERAESGPWTEYRRMVLNELRRIADDIRALNGRFEKFSREDLAQMKTDIALLKFQAALWGAGAGLAATGIITLAIKLFRP